MAPITDLPATEIPAHISEAFAGMTSSKREKQHKYYPGALLLHYPE